MTTTEPIVYNVACLACDQVWQPTPKSRLWWQAKKHADRGYLDAIHVSGEECGCVPKLKNPNAPYRVMGYDMGCQDYNSPFTTFTSAVKVFLKCARRGDVVFITGVSEAVKQKLEGF